MSCDNIQHTKLTILPQQRKRNMLTEESRHYVRNIMHIKILGGGDPHQKNIFPRNSMYITVQL